VSVIDGGRWHWFDRAVYRRKAAAWASRSCQGKVEGVEGDTPDTPFCSLENLEAVELFCGKWPKSECPGPV